MLGFVTYRHGAPDGAFSKPHYAENSSKLLILRGMPSSCSVVSTENSEESLRRGPLVLSWLVRTAALGVTPMRPHRAAITAPGYGACHRAGLNMSQLHKNLLLQSVGIYTCCTGEQIWGVHPVVFGRLSARRIFSGPGHSAGSVLFFCDCRHLSVTLP